MILNKEICKQLQQINLDTIVRTYITDINKDHLSMSFIEKCHSSFLERKMKLTPTPPLIRNISTT